MLAEVLRLGEALWEGVWLLDEVRCPMLRFKVPMEACGETAGRLKVWPILRGESGNGGGGGYSQGGEPGGGASDTVSSLASWYGGRSKTCKRK